MSINLERPANQREREALNFLPSNGLPMQCTSWLAALAQTNLLDVVGYLLARGWVAIGRGGIGADTVYLSEQGRESLSAPPSRIGIERDADAELAAMMQHHVAQLTENVATAEDEQIKRVLAAFGIEPTPEVAAEHDVEVRIENVGRKLVLIGGDPVAWIITEFTAPDWHKENGPVDCHFTTRVEEYR